MRYCPVDRGIDSCNTSSKEASLFVIGVSVTLVEAAVLNVTTSKAKRTT
jgi:hypothetical protein